VVSNSERYLILDKSLIGLPTVLRRKSSILIRNKFSLRKKSFIVTLILSLLSSVLSLSFFIKLVCSTTFFLIIKINKQKTKQKQNGSSPTGLVPQQDHDIKKQVSIIFLISNTRKKVSKP
jgi:hypothetical protein